MNSPRILLLDIETFPDVAYVWGAYDQNAIAIKEHWYIISYAYRWYGKEKVVCRTLYDTDSPTDDVLVQEIYGLMNDADIIVAHNGIDFDVKKINARLIVNGMKPPSPYKVVDTKRAIKRVAGFSSNKLDWLCRQLGLGRKIEHEGFPLWQACAEKNDPAAWKKMAKYNKHDVVLLDELYTLISPWIRQPNFTTGLVCVNPACQSTDLENRGYSRSATRMYRRFVCRTCGKWSQTTISERDGKAMVRGI